MEQTTIVIYADSNIYDDLQRYLVKSEMIEDCARYAVVHSFNAQIDKNHAVEMKVCNAPTDEGGAFIDPVVFQRDGNSRVYFEIIVGDVLGDLTDDFIFVLDDIEYTIKIQRVASYENLHTEPYETCPKCGSRSLSADFTEHQYGSAWRQVECENCGFEYQEIFEFLHNEDFDANVLDNNGDPI